MGAVQLDLVCIQLKAGEFVIFADRVFLDVHGQTSSFQIGCVVCSDIITGEILPMLTSFPQNLQKNIRSKVIHPERNFYVIFSDARARYSVACDMPQIVVISLTECV